MLVAQELLLAWDDKTDIWDLAGEWIETQNGLSNKTTNESNPILLYLNIMKKELIKYEENKKKFGGSTVINNLDVTITKCQEDGSVGVQGFAKDFHSTFSKVCQLRGFQYSYKSTMQLSKRLKDGKKTLEDAGWTVEDDGKNHRDGIYYTATYEIDKSETVK